MKEKDKTLDLKKCSIALLEAIKKYPRLLIYIKGSPDPDALGGSYALKLLCDAQGTEATIISPQEASLPQNIKIIKDLHLPIHFKEFEECKKHFDAYAILDHQSALVEGLTGVIPCAIHIDHHESAADNLPVELQINSEEAGSTSTLIIHLVKALGIPFDQPQWRNAATAMYYGLQTDTDDFLHTGELDHLALDLISPYVDMTLLNRINSLPFTTEVMHFFHRALENQVLYKNWLIAGIGFIEKKHRDTIGIIGDFLLKRENIDLVVVFGIVATPNRLILDASFRAKEEKINLNTLIKNITKEGGARKYKGAFQVNLDYFINCPDRDLLWQMVYTTTIETLKKRRDDNFAGDLQKILGFLKEKIHHLFD